jgi:hypothetical protein
VACTPLSWQHNVCYLAYEALPGRPAANYQATLLLLQHASVVVRDNLKNEVEAV